MRAHFQSINNGGPTKISRQEYHNETARVLSGNEVLLISNFTTYRQDDNGDETLFLSWNMSLIFRKSDDKWLMTHGHLSLRNAFDPDSLPRLRDIWNKNNL
ncbi:hypothetical protein Asuc_1629 [Actinobacillus succinogenes 130Z]|uniref:SnoaL-like domain-containing protein n=1 Tax=Actinobacillus succinogenes (strain ATCC 55618 / DSM 22257 / CCUG 43843 / 130Z) TaxID=339671 RepID=A6VPT6_ACTSZ|nr:hypothetical protein Asuc_1629 [Actinobacillus succinogenes 130Z]